MLVLVLKVPVHCRIDRNRNVLLKMSCINDKLSNELLLIILRCVCNASISSGFIDCLTVCRRWKELGVSLLWTDIVLTNATIGKFVEKIAEAGSSRHPVQSLTLQLNAIWPARSEWGLSHEGGSWLKSFESRNPRTAALEKHLRRLAELMKEGLQPLNNFSLHIERDPIGGRSDYHNEAVGAWIPSSVIGDFVRALPPTCRSLELDTGGVDNHRGGPEHLCCTVRAIMPQLHHLRLRLRRFCPSLVNPNYVGAAPDPAPASSFEAPLLRTMTLNLSAESYHEGGCLCIAMDEESMYAEEHDRNKGVQSALASALRSALQADTFQAIQRLEVFNLHTASKLRSHITHQNIVANESVTLPMRLLMWNPSTFMRSGGHFVLFTLTDEALFGPLPAIEEKVENAWYTTIKGSRFPAAFKTSEEATFAGYQWLEAGVQGSADFFGRWGENFENVDIPRIAPFVAQWQWASAKLCRASVSPGIE